MNELHQETDPELHRALSELMDQTRDLIERQEQLVQQTDAEAQENEDCLSGLLKNDLARPWSEAKARAGRARTHIEGVDPSRFPSYLAEDVDGARGRADDYLAALERYGAKPFDPKGQHFDPQFHEAMSQIPREGAEPGTVIEVFQRGWMLHDRLVRPAMVVIAAGEVSGGPAEPTTSDAEDRGT